MSKGWVAVARLGGVGDNLIAASVLKPLKRLGYKIDMITSEPYHVIFHNNPYIDKLSVKRKGDLPEGDMGAWQRWFEARKGEYDDLIHLSHSCEVRHGLNPGMTDFWASPQYRRKVCAGSYLETVHDIAGMPYDFGPLFWPTEEEKERALKTKREQIGERCIGWVVSGTRIDKVYPYASFVVTRIIKELGIPVVLLSAPAAEHFEYAKQIYEHVRIAHGEDDGIKLTLACTPTGSDPGGHQDWGIRRSLTQALMCDLVISPDTGPAWACAFEPMPKIIMVSHASPENITKHWYNTVTLHADQYRVPCWPCHRLHDNISTCTPNSFDGKGAACISDISVEKLLQTTSDLWKDIEAKDKVIYLREAAE